VSFFELLPSDVRVVKIGDEGGELFGESVGTFIKFFKHFTGKVVIIQATVEL
jgi:hypothetical protein